MTWLNRKRQRSSILLAVGCVGGLATLSNMFYISHQYCRSRDKIARGPMLELNKSLINLPTEGRTCNAVIVRAASIYSLRCTVRYIKKYWTVL